MRIASFDFAQSGLVSRDNPMGWTPRHYGQFDEVAADWMDNLKPAGVDGLMIRFGDGACPKRVVGIRSDGDLITTNALSPDMVSEVEHRSRRYTVRGLAKDCLLIWDTGVPDAHRAELAVDRLMDMHIKNVAVDVLGRNQGDDANRFGKLVRDAGMTLIGEPLAIDHDPAPCLAGCGCIMLSDGLERAMRLNKPIPAGSYAWHNGNRPPTPEQLATWDTAGIGVVIARGLIMGAMGGGEQ